MVRGGWGGCTRRPIHSCSEGGQIRSNVRGLTCLTTPIVYDKHRHRPRRFPSCFRPSVFETDCFEPLLPHNSRFLAFPGCLPISALHCANASAIWPHQFTKPHFGGHVGGSGSRGPGFWRAPAEWSRREALEGGRRDLMRRGRGGAPGGPWRTKGQAKGGGDAPGGAVRPSATPPTPWATRATPWAARRSPGRSKYTCVVQSNWAGRGGGARPKFVRCLRYNWCCCSNCVLDLAVC